MKSVLSYALIVCMIFSFLALPVLAESEAEPSDSSERATSEEESERVSETIKETPESEETMPNIPSTTGKMMVDPFEEQESTLNPVIIALIAIAALVVVGGIVAFIIIKKRKSVDFS